MQDTDKLQEECTHNCMTCGHGCSENAEGVGLFEKALNGLSDIDSGELLAALQQIGVDSSEEN